MDAVFPRRTESKPHTQRTDKKGAATERLPSLRLPDTVYGLAVQQRGAPRGYADDDGPDA
jgi:hypothetical protein